ncbi:EAL and GGDEF domain-containing protein [Rhodoferax sp.]|uniref:sensor domain-containing protein n=1 Tax=Rhodoferax sp. TaxID=50421 RepID=UPI002ACE3F23|nr:EAL domain-containing protein [Rhodoferax sp.]MDZ7921274.1 EAL domain-containing protein [Rhodoferax sp.]
MESISGYTPQEWMAASDFWHSRIHPDDRPMAQAAQAELLQAGQIAYEYRFRHKDGSYRWIHDRVVLLRDKANSTTQVMGTWLDVTDRKTAEMRIGESELRYRELFELNPLPMWVVDSESLAFLSVNDAAVKAYGYTRQEFVGMTLADIRPAEDIPKLLHHMRKRVPDAPAVSVQGEWRHKRKDGTVFWVEITSHTLLHMGRPARLILARDLSERRHAEEQLRLIAHVFEASQEGIFITDAQQRFINVNQAFSQVTGYAAQEVLGQTPKLLHSGRHDKTFYDSMWRQLESDGRWEGEIWNRRKNGEIYPEWLTISAITSAQGRVEQYLGIFTETSGRKAAEERIQHLANYDSLTNLPNRALLNDRANIAISAAIEGETSLAVMHLNVDRFTQINESFGHAAGDTLLIELAQRLLGQLRADETVSRAGGDDFIFLIPNTTARTVAQVAWHVLDSLTQPFMVSGQELRITASMGIAEFPDNGSSFLQLTQAAESAVHEAKRSGRNTVHFFSRSTQDQVKETLALEQDLRYAVERQELVLHYQPQIDVQSGRLIGMEALVRWNHPRRGLISPALFIPVAEESGLIQEIGQWVMQEAIHQNATWRQQGLPVVPVAVNLSVVQFRHPGLRTAVQDALRRSGLPPELLELELTESIAMENSSFTLDTVAGLKSLGVALSIDDFGTGYSWLSYLKRFAIDKLKIDQSFIRGLTLDHQDEAIVTTIIQLARSLGFRTIAEGVETPAQLDFLRAHGCAEYQGYLFSRPVPAAEFAHWLTRPGAG